MTMYDSLKAWLNLPIIRRPFVGYTGAGDKKFGNSIDLTCYIDGSVKLVTNREGSQVASSIQLYIAGQHVLHVQDTITVADIQYEIIAIHPFYRNGKKDMWVVYI